MTEPKSSAVQDRILEEASYWFVEMNERPADEETRQGFNYWLRTSPEHVRVYLEISSHWEDGTPRPNTRVESVDELIALAQHERNVVLLPTNSAQHTDTPLNLQSLQKDGRDRRRLARPRTLALAASVLLTLVATLIAYNTYFADVYVTAIGEQRSLRLDDGSTVQLNARSKIRVRYTDDRRNIDLLEGQALFQVAKDSARPFIVSASNTQVRAIGTQFDINRKRTGTVVTVIEGKVAVAEAKRALQLQERATADTQTHENLRNLNPVPPSSSSHPETSPVIPAPRVQAAPPRSAVEHNGNILLVAGQQLTVSAQSDTSQGAPVQMVPQPVNIATATAWTQRRLVFSRTPLADVVEEFNRYNPVPLVITDPELANTEISGSFSSSDPSSLIRFLRDVGLYSVRESGGVTEISRR
jgi:transmembrane sensor